MPKPRPDRRGRDEARRHGHSPGDGQGGRGERARTPRRRMTVKRTMMRGCPTSLEEGDTVRSAEKEMRTQGKTEEESCSGQEAQWGLWLEPETRRT